MKARLQQSKFLFNVTFPLNNHATSLIDFCLIWTQLWCHQLLLVQLDFLEWSLVLFQYKEDSIENGFCCFQLQELHWHLLDLDYIGFSITMQMVMKTKIFEFFTGNHNVCCHVDIKLNHFHVKITNFKILIFYGKLQHLLTIFLRNPSIFTKKNNQF